MWESGTMLDCASLILYALTTSGSPQASGKKRFFGWIVMCRQLNLQLFSGPTKPKFCPQSMIKERKDNRFNGSAVFGFPPLPQPGGMLGLYTTLRRQALDVSIV